MNLRNITPPRAIRSVRALLLVATAGLAAACESRSPKSYQTEEGRAREALQASLDAWKAGKPSGPVGALGGNGPQIQAIDSDWSRGKKLASFEIAEELPSDASVARRFSVRLTYANQSQPVQAEYHVVGVDPILVFRDKDYAQSRGM